MATLARLLLILLLAFDLVGSPFHSHFHDIGADGAGAQALHALAPGHGSQGVHVEADDTLSFAHSVAALLSAQPQPGKWQTASNAAAHAPRATQAVVLTLPGVSGRTTRERVPIPPFPHLRPDGRAPPLLHS